MLRRLVAAMIVALAASAAGALPGRPALAAATDSLQVRLNRLLARPELQGAKVGLRVVEVPSGRELFAHNANRPLIPASNMKLLTTAAALGLLSDDFRFRTTVGIQGDNLAVIGDGDPTIGSRYVGDDVTAHFRDWARRLRAAGVRSVSGDVLIDDSLFDRQLVHPAWPREQLYRWYAAPVSALTLADNCVELTASPGARAGSSARLRMSPLNDALKLSGTIVTTASRKDHIWSVYRKPGEDEISCSGRFWTGAEADAALITVNKPSEFFGRVLARVFRDEGIEIRGRVRTAAGIDPSALRPRFTQETSLATVVQVANKESQNLYAEQLFKTLGAKRYGVGSWDTGRQAVLDFLRWRQVPTAGLSIDDGSGLSRNNRLTAWHLTELLNLMASSPYRDLYLQSLSEAGVDGTLEERLTLPQYRGRIHAKTGSLRSAYALSGYVETARGRLLAFSLLINNPRRSVRTVQDDLCRALVDAPL